MKYIKYFFQFILIKLFFLIFKLVGYENASNLGGLIGSKIGPFFKSKKTLSINYSKESLIRLRKAIHAYEEEIIEALYKDLKKPKLEAYASEIGVVLTELNYFIKNIKKLTKPKRVKVSFAKFSMTVLIKFVIIVISKVK